MTNLPTLDRVLGGKNGHATPDPYSPDVQQFNQREESVLGRLTRQGVDTLGLNWSRLNSLLTTPDLYEIQQTKNKALWKTGRILWDQVALDDMVDSATVAWISAILQDIRFIPSEDNVEAKWVSDAVTYSMESIKGGLLDRLYAMYSGAGQGFSVNMWDLGIMAEGQWRGWMGVSDIRYMLPHFLVPKFDDGPGGSGALQCVYQADPNNRGAAEELSLDRMMHWRHRPAEDPFAGRSLWVPAHPHWRAKQLLLELRNYNAEWNVGRLEVQHLEQQSNPLPEGEFVRRAEAIIAGYLRFRGYKMWRGMAAKLVQSVHGPEVFDAVIRDCNMAITRSIGPPWLISEPGEGQFGAGGQTDTHSQTFEGKIRPERQRGEELIREGPVRGMCDANGWAPRHRPKVTLARAPEADQQASITLYYQGVDKGVIHPAPSDENEILGRIGWTLRKEQEGTDQVAQPVESLTLNGAQIQSASAIITAIGDGSIPADSGYAMLTGFLPIPADVAERIIGPLRKKEQEAPAPAQQPAAPQTFAVAHAPAGSPRGGQFIGPGGASGGSNSGSEGDAEDGDSRDSSEKVIKKRLEGAWQQPELPVSVPREPSEERDGPEAWDSWAEASEEQSAPLAGRALTQSLDFKPEDPEGNARKLKKAFDNSDQISPDDVGTFVPPRYQEKVFGRKLTKSERNALGMHFGKHISKWTGGRFNPDSQTVKFAQSGKPPWWRRPLTAREQRYKMAGGGRDLGDIMAAMAKAADKEWEGACKALEHKVTGWITSERIGPKEILRRLETLKMDLDGFQGALVSGWTKCYGYGQDQAVRELEIAGAKNLTVPKLTEGAMRFDAKVAPADPLRLGNFIDLMKSESFKVKKGYEDKAFSAIADLLNTAYATGERPEETRAKLETIMAGLAAGHLIEPGKPGHDFTSPAVQETIVRTMANNSFSAARMDLYERNDSFVLGTERSEVAEGHDIGADGKDRSHPLSEHLDQLRVRLDDPRRRKLTGARHFNERGVDIPLTELDEPIEWSTDAELDRAISWGEKLSPRFF